MPPFARSAAACRASSPTPRPHRCTPTLAQLPDVECSCAVAVGVCASDCGVGVCGALGQGVAVVFASGGHVRVGEGEDRSGGQAGVSSAVDRDGGDGDAVRAGAMSRIARRCSAMNALPVRESTAPHAAGPHVRSSTIRRPSGQCTSCTVTMPVASSPSTIDRAVEIARSRIDPASSTSRRGPSSFWRVEVTAWMACCPDGRRARTTVTWGANGIHVSSSHRRALLPAQT